MLFRSIKDPAPALDWRARAERASQTWVVLDRLFGAGSDLREGMHRRGEVDDSLGASYMGDQTYAVATIGCESEDPDAAEAAMRRALQQPVAFDEEHLELVRRRHLGGFVRSCENVRALAFAHAGEQLEGAPPFQGLEILRQLSVDAVMARRSQLLAEERIATAVTRQA